MSSAKAAIILVVICAIHPQILCTSPYNRTCENLKSCLQWKICARHDSSRSELVCPVVFSTLRKKNSIFYWWAGEKLIHEGSELSLNDLKNVSIQNVTATLPLPDAQEKMCYFSVDFNSSYRAAGCDQAATSQRIFAKCVPSIIVNEGGTINETVATVFEETLNRNREDRPYDNYTLYINNSFYRFHIQKHRSSEVPLHIENVPMDFNHAVVTVLVTADVGVANTKQFLGAGCQSQITVTPKNKTIEVHEPSDSKGSRLSAGEIVAIVVSSIIFILLVIGVVWKRKDIHTWVIGKHSSNPQTVVPGNGAAAAFRESDVSDEMIYQIADNTWRDWRRFIQHLPEDGSGTSQAFKLDNPRLEAIENAPDSTERVIELLRRWRYMSTKNNCGALYDVLRQMGYGRVAEKVLERPNR